MGGCCCAEKKEAYPRRDGRQVDRKCTDMPFMVLFWVFVAGMTACIASGLAYGEPKRLTHGANWKGELCGVDPAVQADEFMMFCGSPQREIHGGSSYPKFIIEGSTVCVPSCPGRSPYVDSAPGVSPATVAQISCLMPAFHNFTMATGGRIGPVGNSETLQMVLTQSATRQTPYPTEAFGGRFCLPSEENLDLRDMLINGPWGRTYRPLLAIGGLMDAWPLLLGTAVLAFLMGFIYILVLAKFAGFLIFGTMIMSTLLAMAAGLFFFWAILINTDDPNTTYAKFNPIMSVYIGTEAKIYSIIVGIITIVIGVICGTLTLTSMEHIDEMVGLIEAACDCVNKLFSLWLFVFFQVAALLVLVWFFVLFGAPYVASLGYLDASEININGQSIPGLQHVWRKTFWQHVAMWYYVVGLFFVLELFIQFGHYMIAYMVSKWYFSSGSIKQIATNPMLEKVGLGVGKKTEVRVAGVDTNYGLRHGTVVDTQAGKMLVVPVGKKGPGLGRNEMVTAEFVKERIGLFPGLAYLGASSLSALWYHTGSIALGAPVIFFFRPFRMFAQCVGGFLSKTADPDKGPSYSDDPHNSNIKGCLTLMSACLEQVFGKYSKIAFTELVLNGQDGFLTCSQAAFTFLVRSGGSIAHLHGAMILYELFGTLCITLFCGWAVWIIQEKVDVFNEVESAFYIENKNASLVACMLIAFAIGTSWMSMWNQTADVLLYCVAWNRRQVHLGEEHGVEEPDMIGEVKVFCPQALRYLLPPQEMEAEAEHGLHAHGIGQQGAILAAMAHGTMSGGTTQGPQYSQMVSNAHGSAVQFMGSVCSSVCEPLSCPGARAGWKRLI